MKYVSETQSTLLTKMINKLSVLNEAELRLAYMKLFQEELNYEWQKLSDSSNLANISEKEIDEAILKMRHPHKYALDYY